MQRHAGPASAAAVSAVLLLLGGCLPQLIPEPAQPPLTFDFGPPPDERPAPLPLRFRLETVYAPSWLETPSIYYRRLDEQQGALRAYAQNQWIAPAPELFAERLSNRLAQAAPERSSEELALRLEILRFEQVYTAPDEAYVVARARASYDDLDGRMRRREFERRRATAAAVDGATAALPHVADDLLDGVLEWLREETLALEP